MALKSLQSFIDIAKQKPLKKIAVAAAEDEPVLSAIAAARKEGIVEPILIGNIDSIKDLAKNIGFDLTGVEMIECNNQAAACREATKMARDGKVQIVMKGLVGTADFLRAVLDKEVGIRKEGLLSHIGFFEMQTYHKILALTDAAQNIAPTFDEKLAILRNSIDLFHRLGVEIPKVVFLSAIETVNPKMQSTLDAAAFTMMNRRKQITGCLVDGPLAFDNAISKEAAHHKGIDSEVAGDVDLVLVPNIEVGNALYKSMCFLANATVAAIILGATVPVVLTSRADTDRSKLMSIALAASY